MADAANMPAPEPTLERNGSRSAKRVKTVLSLAAWTLLFSGYYALATVREIGPSILLFPMLLLILAPLGERLDQCWKPYNLLTRGIAITYLCFIPLSVMVLGLTNAVVLLIMFIQSQLLLHRKGEREYLLLYLMSFFLLLAACVKSPEPGIAVAMALFLISAIWAFLTLRIHVEEEQSRALSAPEIIPIDTLHPGAHTGRPSLFDRGLVGAVSGLSVMAVLLTVGIFAFVPRIEAGFFGRGQGSDSTTGLDDYVDLHGDEFLDIDDTPIMHVNFLGLGADKTPDTESLYWRCATMHSYEAPGWSRGRLRYHYDPRFLTRNARESWESDAHRDANPPQVFFADNRRDVFRTRRSDTRVVHYEIFVREMPNSGIPALDLVQRLTVEDERAIVAWEDTQDFTVRLRRSSGRQLDYQAWSEIDTLETSALESAEGDIHAIWERIGAIRDYEMLTYHDLLPETRDFVEELTANASTVYEQAMALEEWFHGPDFVYTLRLPPLPDRNPIDAFMMRYRSGHCELYATAMALSLRSLGVPTRVVSGYLGAEASETDDAYLVRKSMAHLWVEAWLPEYGWTRFDPTPSGETLQLSALQRMTLLFSRQRLKAQMLWYREVVGFSGGIQFSKLKDFSLRLVRGFQLPGEPAEENVGGTGDPVRVPAMVFLSAMVLIVAVFAVRKLRKRKKRIRWNLTGDQRRSVGLYHALRKRLRKCGLPATGGTAGALLDELATSGRAPLDAVRPMIKVYNEVRFGHRPLSRERYAELMRQLKRLEPLPE